MAKQDGGFAALLSLPRPRRVASRRGQLLSRGLIFLVARTNPALRLRAGLHLDPGPRRGDVEKHGDFRKAVAEEALGVARLTPPLYNVCDIGLPSAKSALLFTSR